jgi:hypothetical protein
MMIFFENSDKPVTKKGYVPCHVILYPFCASGLVMLLNKYKHFNRPSDPKLGADIPCFLPKHLQFVEP